MTVPPASPTSPGPKRRIAILGGGCGALSAAWGLVHSAEADQLDITVYQQGWRLGGKGASGRNAALGNRIEEHGLHIWGGMYENAFAIMRDVYGSLNRPRGTPLSVMFDPDRPQDSAFLPHSNTTFGEFYNGTWTPWNIDMPTDSAVPGDGRLLPTVDEYLDLLLDLFEEVLFGDNVPWQRQHAPKAPSSTPSVFALLADGIGTVVSEGFRRVARWIFQWLAGPHMKRARAALNALPDDAALHTFEHLEAISAPLDEILALFGKWFQHWLTNHPGVRRMYMIADLGATILRGVLADHLLRDGLDTVDGEEFRDWLQRHGANDITLDGVLVRGWHAFFFAYAGGDPSQQSLSAASGLRTLFRYCFTYRGAFFWKMQAGMGDTIFAPLYQALKAKGVKFEFFHRVEELSFSNNGVPSENVESIRIQRQVTLRAGLTEYSPLMNVLGVDSWPSEPFYDQIDPAQAAALQKDNIDLESWWAPWKGVEPPKMLVRGVDFDDVILAIPPAAAKFLTPELVDRSPAWRDTMESLPSCVTIGAQIWLSDTIDDMGWPHPSTVGTVYANPLNTWANMDQLLKRESWAEQGVTPPKSVIYFCGTMTDAEPVPPFTDHTFPTLQDDRAKETTVAWLDSALGPLYPVACHPGTPQIHWRLMVPPVGKGERHFDNQYWTINIDPSERYVLSIPGTASHRPRAHDLGIANLYLAGDWLRTGLNAGCVEAAVMGGLMASQAMTGYPKEIVGNNL